MIPAEDVVARRVLPTLRAMVAHELRALGLKEREVARRMGLTQAAVSKYLRGRGRREAAVAASPRFKGLAKDLAAGLSGETMSAPQALAALREAVRAEESRGLVCRLHEEEVEELKGLGCDLCVRGESSALLEDEAVLGDLRAGLRVLEASRTFAGLIPSVGSNLARARPGARTAMDVAAVPGRIFEMRGAVRVPAAPEFGASRHVAQVLLAVSAARPDRLAALNVRVDGKVVQAARAMGWSPVKFDPAYEGRAQGISKALGRGRKGTSALYHEGAFGIEPIMYLVAADARGAAGMAEALGSRLLGA